MKTLKNNNAFRHYSLIDEGILQFDIFIRTLHGKRTFATRPTPAEHISHAELTPKEQKHSAGLMRVNHTGEVCAQALYQGQALTAKLPDFRAQLKEAAIEEEDHLAWCQQRLNELETHSSYLNPIWYALSFGVGAAAGAISDKLSLGFVAATEDQVCSHLNAHFYSLPHNDTKSKAIVCQMAVDEAAHSAFAKESGGRQFSQATKQIMSQIAKIMTWTSYRI